MVIKTILKKTAVVTLLLAVLTSSTPAFAYTINLDERYMIDLINRERRAAGVRALEVDPRLALMARNYAQEMVDGGFFGHNSPKSGTLLDRIVAAGIPDGWTLAGENLAGAPTVQAAFDGFMGSAAHKANMLESKWTHIGVGAVAGGPYGKMFTVDFIAYPPSMYFTSNITTSDVLVYLDGELMFFDPPAFIRTSRTLGPVRQLAEENRASVAWDGQSRTVTVEGDNVSIELKIGSTTAKVNGQPVQLDVPPTIYNNRTFVPLRFIAETLGAEVAWNGTLRTVQVSTP